MAHKDGPREQGRYRVHHRPPPDRLYTLNEMAALLGVHPHTLWSRMRANNGTVPPAFQPGGPGTMWRFSERSYLAWLDTQTGEVND
jgi:predicted DNA-binding transcriptional regulator AlpA